MMSLTPELSVLLLASVLLGMVTGASRAAEWVAISPLNHADYDTDSRTVKAFWGDYALRNDQIAAAIADPERVSGRSSTRWAMANVGGAVIGLARRQAPRDLLTAYYPGPLRYKPAAHGHASLFRDDATVAEWPGREGAAGEQVTLDVAAYEVENGRLLMDLDRQAPQVRGAPRTFAEVRYTLADGWPYLQVEVNYVNPTEHPFEVDADAVLRVDGAFDVAQQDFDGRLFMVWNAWRNTAYGVLSADDHRLQPAGRRHGGHRLRHVTGQGGPLTVPPGGSVRVVRYLIPGGDLFHVRAVAAERLGRVTVPVRLELTAPDGPVADAEVTAYAGGARVGAGRSDQTGTIEVRIVPEPTRFEVAAFGRPAQTVTVDPANETGPYRVVFDAAAVVRGEIDDANGAPIPCKIAFHGREGTPDPFFFPETGSDRVRNLIYASDGRFRQVLPPGRYRLVISYGPEYDAVTRDIEVTRGAETAVQAVLAKAVQTDGWISADMHNHSAISGFSEIFYVYPYDKCPSVDGDSIADPLGRVLNLLCEHIEFTVPTEHNFITSYAPLLERLGATARMKTVPGIGYTAGRRHTVSHQNAFPMTHVPGMEDGGAPQRPEHVGQLSFMAGWYGDSEKLIQVAFPRAVASGIQRGMHALDVQDLEPIVTGDRIPGADNRILEWIGLLNRGFRIPGMVGGGAFHNFHGSGRLRSYVRNPAAHPADIDPLDVVRAVKRGNVVMTTGPFLEVVLSDGAGTALPGELLRAADGRVEAAVRVQCANWMDVDRIQILLNGERRADLDFSRRTHQERFGAGVVKFDQRIPLALERDTHVIVVASGQGPDYHAHGGGSDASRLHVAVSNPIYADVGEEGFRPHSPLDDAVGSSLEFLVPLLAAPDAEPGRVRLTMNNNSDDEAEDTVTLMVVPEQAARILGPAVQAYRIPPGGRVELDWDLVLTDAYREANFPISSTYHNAGSFGVRIERSAKYPGRQSAARHMAADIPVGLLPPVAAPEHLVEHLSGQPGIPMATRNAQPWAWIRYAVAGDDLAVLADVRDPNPMLHAVITDGACIEIFAAMDGRDAGGGVTGGYYPVRQVYLTPALEGNPAAAHVSSQLDPAVAPAPAVRVRSHTTAQGYRIQALIPLAILGLDLDRLVASVFFGGSPTSVRALGIPPLAGRFLMEARVTARTTDGNVRRAAMFNVNMPHQYHYAFGRFRIRGRVRAAGEVLRGLSADPGGPPAQVRLRLHNTGNETAADEVALWLEPEGSGRIVGEASLPFRLDPGETLTRDISVAIEPGAQPGSLHLIAQRTPGGNIAATVLATLDLMDRELQRRPPLDAPAAVAAALSGQLPHRILIDGKVMAEIRLAVAGADLALMATVTDRRPQVDAVPWRASCLEVFGAQPEGGGIGQVFLTPAIGETPAAGHRSEGQRIVASPDIRVASVQTDTGYDLHALIPLERLTIAPESERMLLEFQLTTAPGPARPVARGTAFGSLRAYQDSVQYGIFRPGKP